MKNKNNKIFFYGILFLFVLLFFVAAIFVYDIAIPVPFFGALMGVFITVFVTYALLDGQTKSEANRDKDVRVFQKKIQVYSKFLSKMWNFFYDYQTMKDDDKDSNYEKLRIMCFDELVFFLEKEDIEKLTKVIKKIKPGGLTDNYSSICEITDILQDSIKGNGKGKKDKKEEPKKEKKELLKELYEAFDQKDKSEKTNSNPKADETDIRLNDMTILLNEKDMTFWHFNMFGEEQIKALKNKNWVLNLIEYGEEEWRTKTLEQVKPNDIVFLFRRGGYGYIGAFKVVGREVLENKTYKQKYSETDIKKYDIYDALADGATYSSNLIVEPIAYNYNGVGCLTVRRRTIERINDMEAVK